VFDFIFLDPPTLKKRNMKELCVLLKNPYWRGIDIVIAEHRKTFELPASLGALERVRHIASGRRRAQLLPETSRAK